MVFVLRVAGFEGILEGVRVCAGAATDERPSRRGHVRKPLSHVSSRWNAECGTNRPNHTEVTGLGHRPFFEFTETN